MPSRDVGRRKFGRSPRALGTHSAYLTQRQGRVQGDAKDAERRPARQHAGKDRIPRPLCGPLLVLPCFQGSSVDLEFVGIVSDQMNAQ